MTTPQGKIRPTSAREDDPAPAVTGSEVISSELNLLREELSHLREILSRPHPGLDAVRDELSSWELSFRAKLEDAKRKHAELQDEVMRWQIATADAHAKSDRLQRKLRAALAREVTGEKPGQEFADEGDIPDREPEQLASSDSAPNRTHKLELTLREFYSAVVNPITVAVASAELLSGSHSLSHNDKETLAEIHQTLKQVQEAFRGLALQLSQLGVISEGEPPPKVG